MSGLEYDPKELSRINAHLKIIRNLAEELNPEAGNYLKKFIQYVSEEKIAIKADSKLDEPFSAVHILVLKNEFERSHFFEVRISPLFRVCLNASYEQREELIRRFKPEMRKMVRRVFHLTLNGENILTPGEYRNLHGD